MNNFKQFFVNLIDSLTNDNGQQSESNQMEQNLTPFSNSLFSNSTEYKNSIFETKFNFFEKNCGKNLNILLLGESGAGKSTSINAIANYMKYTSIDEAARQNFIDLIPSKFTLGDDSDNMITISSSGNDAKAIDNERMESGKSSTKEPQSYLFKQNDTTVRFIDTPGIGDTEGVDADEENFKKIFNYLHMFKELHGIIIFIKTTETRLTDFFKYCISELLTQLHKSACKNIILCFTFSRSSHFQAGDAFFILKDFVKNELEISDLVLKSKVNCFFIDNEAYRFLLAKKCNYIFLPDQINDYRSSWNNSVEQTNLMLNVIANLSSHDLEETISLNNSRKFIYQMAEPMVDLSLLLEVNIKHIQNQENELLDVNKNKEELARSLNILIDDIIMDKLPYPTTVCTANKCTTIIVKENGDQITHYGTRCHERCQLTGVAVNITGDRILENCWAMAGTGKCAKKCGCPFNFHRHIYYVTKIVKKNIIDQRQKQKIDSKEKAIEAIEETIKQTKQIIKEMEKEIEIIQKIGAKFAYILVKHSSTVYNKFLEPYLKLLIQEEEKKIGNKPSYSTDKLKSLEKMLKTHQSQVSVLKKAIKSNTTADINIKEVGIMQKQLFGLKHTGLKFKTIFDLSNKNTVLGSSFFDVSVNL